MYEEVSRPGILIVCLLFSRLQGSTERGVALAEPIHIPLINVADRQLTDDRLLVRYQIQNRSEREIWICQDVDVLGLDSETYLSEDAKTLVVRRRLDVPMRVFRNPPLGRYVRLRAGESRDESLVLSLPVRYRGVLGGDLVRADLVYVENLSIELGYFTGNLPKMVYALLDKAENSNGVSADAPLARVREYLGGLPMFYEQRESEYVRHRDTEFLMYYSFQSLTGEHVLRAEVRDMRIPYHDQRDRGSSNPLPPAMGACERMEVQVSPSALEFFFPDPSEQSLLSASEAERLRSLRSFHAADRDRIAAFADEISEPQFDATFTCGSRADIVCGSDLKHPTRFSICGNMYIMIDDHDLMRYPRGLPGFSLLSPEIIPFALRQRCARNLSNLGSRFRSFGVERREYPTANQWCDAILSLYEARGYTDDFIAGPFRCPSAGEGKCHYGMNNECRAASPPDMVLLFETKGGWNRHGGPESFTFENHDPKGGLVLLNDGTVKFIRTEEELKQLRWK
jgi:hypothetical protein